MHSEKHLIDSARKISEAYTFWMQFILKLGSATGLQFNYFTRLNSNHFIKEFQKLKKYKKRTYALYSLFKSDFLKQYCHFDKSIKETQSCCRNQDLHLMRHRQFLLRKKLFSKKIIDWKLLTQVISRERIDYFHIKSKQFSSISFKNYLIKPIELKNFKKQILEDQKKQDFRYQNSSTKLYGSELGGGSSSLSVH